MCSKNPHQLNMDTFIDHSYSGLSKSTKSNEEVTYSKFEVDLNKCVELSSTIINNEKRPQNEQSKYTGKYFKPYPEIQQQNALVVNNKNKKRKAILLPNGSHCSAVILNNNTYFLRNTCSFDSIVQILATAGIDNIEYHRFLEKATNHTLNFVYNFITNGISKNLFAQRAQILIDCCMSKTQKTITNKILSYTIDAENNIANLIQQILQTNPSKCNTEKCTCGERTIYHSTIAPNHTIISKKGFRALQEALEFWSPIYNINCCNACLGKLTCTDELGEHIFIELDVRHHHNLKQSLRCSLGEFPTTINFHLRNEETSNLEYRYI